MVTLRKISSFSLVVVALLAIIISTAESRIVNVERPEDRSSEVEEQSSHVPRQVFYLVDPRDQQQNEEDDTPVVIPRQQTAGFGRAVQHSRLKEQPSAGPKQPPVATIRNFNKLNDDGSFTFGYEAADGSFKEETRGTDCVVRGKYGYIDPDGNKREFTYASGNPCDPNAINQEDEEEQERESSEKSKSNQPENYPQRPALIKQTPRSRPAAPTTLFQQNFDDQEDERQLQVSKAPVRQFFTNSINVPEDDRPELQLPIRSTPRPALAPSRIAYPVNTRLEEQPATTYRPQPSTPSIYAPKLPSPSPFPLVASSPQPSYFDEQFKKFQLDNNLVPSENPTKPLASGNQFSTELVFDPASGQYNTVVYQKVPRYSAQEQPRIPFFASTTRRPQYPQRQLIPSTALPRGTAAPQEQLIRQQQANLVEQSRQQQANLVQQSQQLYNQQLKAQQLQQQQSQRAPIIPKQLPLQPHQYSLQRFPTDPKLPFQPSYAYHQQPFYFVNAPLTDERQRVSAGQIDAFLQGHNFRY